MTAWAAPEVLSALKADLEALPALTGLPAPAVRVFTAWPTADYSVTDALILGYSTDDTVDASALGRNRYDEAGRILSSIRILRAGAGETKAVEARDRAKAVLDIVDARVRSGAVDLAGANEQVVHMRVTDHEMLQFPDPGGGDPPVPLRVCVVDFVISYKARTST